MGRPAKALSVLKRTVGSNPTLSARCFRGAQGTRRWPQLRLSTVILLGFVASLAFGNVPR